MARASVSTRSFSESPFIPAVAGHHHQAKRGLLQVLPRFIKHFLILELGRVGLVENLFSLVTKGLHTGPHGEFGDLVLRQVARIFISAILEEPSHQEVVLQRFRTLREIGRSLGGLIINRRTRECRL